MSASGSNRDYARRALDVLADEAPAHYAILVIELRRLSGRYRVGSETFAILARDGAVVVDDVAPAQAVLDVAIEAPDIVRLLDGTVMIEVLLRDERLRIVADSDALLRLANVVATVLDGALHLRALQDLFDEYRAWVAAPKGIGPVV